MVEEHHKAIDRGRISRKGIIHHGSSNSNSSKESKEMNIKVRSVTPRFSVPPEWQIRTESEARDYILGLFTYFFFRAELVPVGIQTISLITKIIYIYKRTTTGVVSIKIYTHILSPIYIYKIVLLHLQIRAQDIL